ncbi:uncharacterized protein N7503_000563 [Penicillium pulvis]|uniref:uncharacterized protein n=1 Tax=Penicillium pulvis TaxID=1562058 RepID=UPI0025472CB2|nr:uncharacterized protein N7503_000563 [Penicillium pulvis]KAJ5813813.1 hypothetical protein N7503_000563 [Penicillium pulvis]
MQIPRIGMQQICLDASNHAALITPTEVGHSERVRDREAYTTSILQSNPASVWPEGSITSHSHPMLVNVEDHIDQIKDLQEALTLAIVNIVGRWWDPETDFPSRMPLEPYEEDLLKWMENLPTGTVPPFDQCLGSWRPDFLIEEVPNSTESKQTREKFRICEINARFCWNGFFHSAYGQQALVDMGAKEKGFRGAANCEEIIDGLFTLFDTSKTLHLLKGQESGIDIGMLAWAVERRTGIPPRFIKPEDLRLVPCKVSLFGQKLCCVIPDEAHVSSTSTVFRSNGERLEEIHQVNLELRQRELRAMPTDILRHLSLRCFNDMRTILLVHDKRMLGLILQELDSLVSRHKVLTPAQATILREGISTTLVPGSLEMKQFIDISRINPNLKNQFLLKPIRGGKGAGILFGDELSPEDWQSKIEGCVCAMISPDRTSYIVQRTVPQAVYDVVSRDGDESKQVRLVGTYLVINGQYFGLGIWRASQARICAISQGASWMCSILSI